MSNLSDEPELEAIRSKVSNELDEIKKLMEWDEHREPTVLEYLRYYRSGTIGERHIEAVLERERVEAVDKYIDYTIENLEIMGVSRHTLKDALRESNAQLKKGRNE